MSKAAILLKIISNLNEMSPNLSPDKTGLKDIYLYVSPKNAKHGPRVDKK